MSIMEIIASSLEIGSFPQIFISRSSLVGCGSSVQNHGGVLNWQQDHTPVRQTEAHLDNTSHQSCIMITSVAEVIVTDERRKSIRPWIRVGTRTDTNIMSAKIIYSYSKCPYMGA